MKPFCFLSSGSESSLTAGWKPLRCRGRPQQNDGPVLTALSLSTPCHGAAARKQFQKEYLKYIMSITGTLAEHCYSLSNALFWSAMFYIQILPCCVLLCLVMHHPVCPVLSCPALPCPLSASCPADEPALRRLGPIVSVSSNATLVFHGPDDDDGDGGGRGRVIRRSAAPAPAAARAAAAAGSGRRGPGAGSSAVRCSTPGRAGRLTGDLNMN